MSLASCFPWGAWPPIPLRFVLTRLLWARSVRRPGALARARLFSAAPVGAGGWGGGQVALRLLSWAGGGPSPLPRGVGAGAPAACGPVGGGGGGSRRGLPAPLLGGGLRYSILAPLVLSAHSLRRARAVGVEVPPRGGGGVRGGPWTAPPGAPADLNPPSALPEWAVVTGGSCGARPPYCSVARVAPARWCGLAPRPRPSREQVQPHPPPRVAVSSGGGGGAFLRLWGGGGPLLWLPSWGGRGGGVGGPLPRPPCPVGRRPAFRCPRRAPPGYTCAVGVAGRPRASGAVRSAADGSVRRGGGGGVRTPVFPGPASDKAAPFAPSWASPVRCRSAAGRACGRLPRPWCPRTPGAAASSGGVWGRRFFGLPPSALGPEWEGGGGVGGALWSPGDASWRRGGGRHGGPGPGGQPSAGRSHPSPAPLYLEPDPSAGPRWGPSSPRPSSRGAGQPGAAVRVSGQRLAGCGAAGSPPRSLSPLSLPQEAARSPASCHTVEGAWVREPSSPSHFLASAVWAVTCAAACVGAGAVAAAGCAGGSSSGRARCARPGGASCWQPHP